MMAVVPTGIPGLDELLGGGGLVEGTMALVEGPNVAKVQISATESGLTPLAP
jgi:KaiC/GvpD/RAD55 family RecA-like ATPase